MNSTTIESHWYPETKLLRTQICGDVDTVAVDRWEQTLHQALGQIPDGSQFAIFVNMHGFRAMDINAHKRFRAIIPLTLAQYGWKVGYVDMFAEEAATISYSNTRGIQCIKAAHCHQDSTKMELYQRQYSRENEHFFTQPEQAQAWIGESKTE